MRRLNRLLHYIGVMLGAAIVTLGFIRFSEEGAVVPLLIALAIIIAGPVENALIWRVKRTSRSPEQCRLLTRLVDLTTSIGFLLCLGLASLLT